MKKKSSNISTDSALKQLMEICSRAEKSPFDIEKKLKDWGLESDSEYILRVLQKERFLDSKRFALAFARDKMKFNKWGKTKIRYMLSGHKIPSDIIEYAISQIDEAEYSDMVSEEMNKKMKSLKIKNPYQKKAKLYAFGNQRGYEADKLHRFFNEKGFQ